MVYKEKIVLYTLTAFAPGRKILSRIMQSLYKSIERF